MYHNRRLGRNYPPELRRAIAAANLALCKPLRDVCDLRSLPAPYCVLGEATKSKKPVVSLEGGSLHRAQPPQHQRLSGHVRVF